MFASSDKNLRHLNELIGTTNSLHHSGRTEGQAGYPQVMLDICIQATEFHTILFHFFCSVLFKKTNQIFLLESIVLVSLTGMCSITLGSLKGTWVLMFKQLKPTNVISK